MVKRKHPGDQKPEKERPVGPPSRHLHRDVVVSSLPDAVVLNEAQTGFRLDVALGERLVVVRPRDGGKLTSVCQVIRAAESELGDGSVETWDETLGQWFCFAPLEVALAPEAVTVKKLGSSRTTLG